MSRFAAIAVVMGAVLAASPAISEDIDTQIYRAEAPLNAEMRVRTANDGDAIIKIVAAATAEAGEAAPATCYVLARGRFEGDGFHAALEDPLHSAYQLDGDIPDGHVSIEASDDALRVEGRADYCGLHADFAGVYRAIDHDETEMFIDCAQGIRPCWYRESEIP